MGAAAPGSGQSCGPASNSLGLSILCVKQRHLAETDGELGGWRWAQGRTMPLSFLTLSPSTSVNHQGVP